MWKCERCNNIFDDKTTAIEVRFGYVDSEETAETKRTSFAELDNFPILYQLAF
jgi:hypothetical protein